MKTSTLRNAISIALFTVLTGTAELAAAQEAATDATRSGLSPSTNRLIDRDFDLPAGGLAAALDALRTQSDIQIGYQDEQVAGKQAKAVSGRMHWRDALGELLQGSGLEYRQIDDSTLVIQNAKKGAASADGPAGARLGTTTPRAAATDLEAITVTGTRIRGGTSPSPVITIGSERIQEEGFTDLGEVIRSVPQNFTGGQNPGVLMGNVTGGGAANQNLGGGSALNLRGLGPDASLTLLNGRRMSYGGFVQSVDISAIPVEAVERIEIVADGASAIYGSDAVGGVANVVLKRDFDGFALGARYGSATDGGLATREYTATAGTVWSSGGLIATYKDASNDPIYAGQRDYTAHLPEPSMLYPRSDSRSGLLSAYQSLGGGVELRLDALRTRRELLQYHYFGTNASYIILSPESTTSIVAPTVEFPLPNDWMMSIGGTWAEDEVVTESNRHILETGALAPVFNDCYCNSSRAYEVGAEGPLFSLRGGDARLAVGAGHRKNEFQQANFLTGTNTAHGAQSSRFAYAEINLPLVSSESGIAGLRRFEVSAAVRGEDYDSFGSVSTPKLGLIYGPGNDFTLKASWGKSFKAPTLLQQSRAHTAQASRAATYGGAAFPSDAQVLVEGGGNADLGPERARTWTASLAFHPEAVSGLEAELTWFDIDYTDRVVEPVNFVQALSNPAYAEFITLSPTVEAQAALIASVDQFFVSGSIPSYDPSRVVAIIHARYVNATRQQARGFDLSASYRFDLGDGQLSIRGSSSWLDSSQQTTTTVLDLSGTIHNPAKISSRLGAVWHQAGFTASTFANYISGVTDTGDGHKGASFTTIDTTLQYSMGGRPGAWSGVDVGLSVNNLFDRPPPLYAPNAAAYVAPYDSTNYSAIGRFLSLSISKRW